MCVYAYVYMGVCMCMGRTSKFSTSYGLNVRCPPQARVIEHVIALFWKVTQLLGGRAILETLQGCLPANSPLSAPLDHLTIMGCILCETKPIPPSCFCQVA